MTIARIAGLLAITTIVCASGCIPMPQQTGSSLALFDSDNNTSARVAIGGLVTVSLTDNSGSTGCSWAYVPANDQVLELLIDGVKQGTGVGAAGQAVFVFSAKTVGTTSLRIEKTCPDGSKTSYTVQLTVMPGGF